MNNHPVSIDRPWEAESQTAFLQKSGHGYRVGIPEKKNFFEEFSFAFRETFFHDDPLYHYKDQPRRKQFWLGLQSFFPILGWGRHYNLKKFKGDLLAGLTIASLCIPQDIGYAKLANVPPNNGLYTSFVPPLVYAAMGSSRDIAIGPVAVVSLLLGELLKHEINPKKHPEEYLHLAFTATFFAGITQVALGFLRLGFLVEFLSHAAVVGFMAGAAITIGLQQLKGLLGIKNFTTNTDIVSVMHSVFSNAHHGWNWQTVVIGMSFLVFLLTAKYIAYRNHKFFWLVAVAPLTSVIVGTFCVYRTRVDKDGVNIVRHLDKGINSSSVYKIYWSGPYLVKGAKIGILTGIIGLTEAIAIGRTFATLKGYQIDGNKEMMALGFRSNKYYGFYDFLHCSNRNEFHFIYVIFVGSFSRSAVNFMAGCKTAMSNIVMSLVVLLTLLLITPLFKYTPNAVIAAIIINAVVGLIDIKAAARIWKVDKLDFLALLGAFFGVIFKSVEVGLLIAVMLSIGKILFQVTRPKTALFGNLPRTNIYRNVEQYPEAVRVPGVLIIRVDSAIYFSNSNYLKERILRWLRDEEDLNKEHGLPRNQHLVLEMSAVTDIDTSGILELEELLKALKKLYVQLELANPGPLIMDKFLDANYVELIGPEHIFLSVDDAVAYCTSKFKATENT